MICLKSMFKKNTKVVYVTLEEQLPKLRKRKVKTYKMIVRGLSLSWLEHLMWWTNYLAMASYEKQY